VGAGPGALTAEVAGRIGGAGVSAVEPSEPFAAALRERFPDSDIRRASAEALPFPDDEFDATLAQLVVQFLDDPVAGIRELARVTRTHGTVAACVWDHAGRRGPLSTFWAGVRATGATPPERGDPPGTRGGDLARILTDAGLGHVQETALTVRVVHASFEEWWEPYEHAAGPAGAYVATLDAAARQEVREACRALLPAPPFTITGTAWAARGTV
jgi:SAM-dependent methyltransferase